MAKWQFRLNQFVFTVFQSEMANPLEAESFQVFEVDIGNAVNQVGLKN